MKIKNKKKFILLLVVIILLLIAGVFIIRYFLARNSKNNTNNNTHYVLTEKLNCKNNLVNIDVENVEIYDIDEKIYLVMNLNNKTGKHQIDLPLKLNIYNIDGDIIFETGTVKKLLAKEQTNKVYFQITPEIKKTINEHNTIDYIELLKLD